MGGVWVAATLVLLGDGSGLASAVSQGSQTGQTFSPPIE